MTILPAETSAFERFTPRPWERGLTLIELLVVISIIAVLAALLLPTIKKSRETANALKCVAKLRAIGTAINLYGTEKMAYPKAGHFTTGFTGESWWFADVMPYLDQAAYTGAVNDTKDTTLRCPMVKTARSWPFIDYGLNGYMLPSGPSDIPIMKINQPSTTFLVAESDVWTIQSGETLDKDFRFRHGKAANVVMFDGHVEKVTREQLADPEAERQMKGLTQ